MWQLEQIAITACEQRSHSTTLLHKLSAQIVKLLQISFF